MKSHLMRLAIATLAVFAPIGPTLATALGLVVADLIAGVWAAKKSGIAITSSGLKVTVVKLLVYEISLLLAFVTETYLMGGTLPITKIVGALIGLTELKSILENIKAISGLGVIESILQKLKQSDESQSNSNNPH